MFDVCGMCINVLYKCCFPAVNLFKTGMLLFLMVTSLGIIMTGINHKATSFEQFRNIFRTTFSPDSYTFIVSFTEAMKRAKLLYILPGC